MAFDVAFPQYEVITVQTLSKYTVKSLSFADELELRGNILASQKSLVQQFNKILFKMIVDKPAEITDYDTWLDKTTIVDRKSITMGLYHISYGDTYILNDKCPNCGATNESKIDITKYVKMAPYEGAPFAILDDVVTLELPISKAIATIGIPNLRRELYSLSYSNIDDKLSGITQIVRSIVVGNQTFKNESETDFFQLSNLIKALPSRDVKVIADTFTDKYNAFDIKVSYSVNCVSCKNTFQAEVDFVEQLFRAVI